MDQSTSVDEFASPQPERYKNTLKETDSVKLDKKKTSVFFALVYFLSTPVSQTEV